jgi:CBS domain-containing protein
MKFDKVPVMDVNSPVSEAISQIIKGEPCVIVTKNNNYHGIFSELDVRHVIDTSKEKLGTVCDKAPLLTEMIDVRDAVKMFLNGKYKALPLLTSDGFKVIKRSTLLQLVKEKKMLPEVSVGEVMTTPLITVDDRDNVGKVQNLMRQGNVRRVIVTKGGMLEGIIAMRDLLVLHEKPNRRADSFLTNVKGKEGFDQFPVTDFMQSNVKTILPETSLSQAVDLLSKSTGSSVIIVEGNHPIGILSARDVLELAAMKKEVYPINFSGLGTAEAEYEDELKSLAEKTYEKVIQMVPVEYMAIHYKKQRTEGLKTRYEVHVRIRSNNMITVTNADWDVRTATQGAMKDFLKVVKKHASK